MVTVRYSFVLYVTVLYNSVNTVTKKTLELNPLTTLPKETVVAVTAVTVTVVTVQYHCSRCQNSFFPTCLFPLVSRMEKMYSARSSGDACTIMYTEIANSSMAPAGTPFVALARHALASSPADPLRLVRPRLNRRRMRYFKLFKAGAKGFVKKEARG